MDNFCEYFSCIDRKLIVGYINLVGGLHDVSNTIAANYGEFSSV